MTTQSNSEATAAKAAAQNPSAAKPPTTTAATNSPAKSDANHLLLKSNLKQLRLPTMKAEFEQLAREAAQSNQTFEQYLLRLTELEVSARASNTLNQRIRQAQFPVHKDLDTYDFSALPSLSKQKVFIRRCTGISSKPAQQRIGAAAPGKPPVAAGTGSRRLDYSTRQRLPDRSTRHWEDASFDRIGPRRLS